MRGLGRILLNKWYPLSVEIHQAQFTENRVGNSPTVGQTEALRILIVDDEPAILEFLGPLIAAWGHEAVPQLLSTEDDAKKIIEAVRATAFDVVISDVIMPGMDGLHLIESLAPISPTTVFIISDAGACIECSAELKKKGLWVQYLLKPFERQQLQAMLHDVSLGFGRDFRRLQRGRIRVEAQPLLADGDHLAQLLGPTVSEFVKGFDLTKAPPRLWPDLIRTAQRLVFYGLRTHCLLFGSPYRQNDQSMDLDALYEKWLVKSLTVSSFLRGYNADCHGIPGLIFDSVFDSEVETIQRQLALGWWRKMKNRGRFRQLFDSGILLAMMHDINAKELTDSGNTTRKL